MRRRPPECTSTTTHPGPYLIAGLDLALRLALSHSQISLEPRWQPSPKGAEVGQEAPRSSCLDGSGSANEGRVSFLEKTRLMGQLDGVTFVGGPVTRGAFEDPGERGTRLVVS